MKKVAKKAQRSADVPEPEIINKTQRKAQRAARVAKTEMEILGLKHA